MGSGHGNMPLQQVIFLDTLVQKESLLVLQILPMQIRLIELLAMSFLAQEKYGLAIARLLLVASGRHMVSLAKPHIDVDIYHML